MATISINASLSLSFSTSGFTALQPNSPVQYYTPATGQRAYTIADAIGALNNQINSNTDPTVAADSPDVLYTFQTSSDGMIMMDNIVLTARTNLATYNDGTTYIQGAWQ
jgi:hypothetical protein